MKKHLIILAFLPSFLQGQYYTSVDLHKCSYNNGVDITAGYSVNSAWLYYNINSYTQSAEGENLVNSKTGNEIPYVSGIGTDQIFDLSVISDTRFNKNAYIGNSFSLPEYYDFPWFDSIYYDVANPYHWKIKDFHYRYYEHQAYSLTNIGFAKLTYSNGILISSDELLLYATEQIEYLDRIKNYINLVSGVDSEELITGGDFSNPSDWDVQSAWVISGGTANYDKTSNVYMQNNGVTVVSGQDYTWSFNVLNLTTGSAYLALSNSANASILAGGYMPYNLGTNIIDFTSSAGSTSIRIFAQTISGSIFSLDNMSLKRTNYYKNEK